MKLHDPLIEALIEHRPRHPIRRLKKTAHAIGEIEHRANARMKYQFIRAGGGYNIDYRKPRG